MREDKELYRQAVSDAWKTIDAKLRDLAKSRPHRPFVIKQIVYDPMPGDSIIEELPERAKSSRPWEIEVAARLQITYEWK